MRASLLLAVLALACSLTPPFVASARAQECGLNSPPSNDCPARGVSPSATSYPCYSGQIKGDWYSMRYYQPWQSSYATIGRREGSDVSCFSSAEDAEGVGFSRS